MTHPIWYDACKNKEIIQEKGVFYYVYQKIFTRGTCSGGGNGCPFHTYGALLLYRNADPICGLRGSMVWLPMRDAARSRQNISINCGDDRMWSDVNFNENKEVCFQNHHFTLCEPEGYDILRCKENIRRAYAKEKK